MPTNPKCRALSPKPYIEVPVRVEPVKAMAGKRVTALSFGGQHSALLCVPERGGAGAHAAKRAR